MEGRHWLVVGLSGVTCGGKSTLASRLLPSLPTTCVYLGQDEYIFLRHYQGHLKAPESVGGINKDSLRSVNMTRMMQDVEQILATSDPSTLDLVEYKGEFTRAIGAALKDPKPPFIGLRREEGKSNLPPVLLLDGFLLFNHAEAAAACDLLYFITLTKDQCWERRQARFFTNSIMKSREYFDVCVWPKYEEHYAQMCDSVGGIRFIDGASQPDLIYERVRREVVDALETWSSHRQKAIGTNHEGTT